MGKLQIELLGASFSAQASEDDAYLAKLLSYYKEITESIKNSSGVKDSLKISILSGIALVDELYKEKQKSISLSKAATVLLNETSKSNVKSLFMS